jgi:hypothetical protein
MPRLVVAIFVPICILLASCDRAPLFASPQEEALRTELTPTLGPVLARAVAAEWRSAFVDAAKLEAVANASDFREYRDAIVDFRNSYREAVDGTIRRLDHASDQGWRRLLLAEALKNDPPAPPREGEGTGEDIDGRADVSAKSITECFPPVSGGYESPLWRLNPGLAVAMPREVGEVARAELDLQTDSGRLAMYFVTAIGAELVWAMGEAADGFANPSFGDLREREASR